MIEQPASKMLIEGVWGCCPNKQFAKIGQRDNQENEQTCTGLHCLPICNDTNYDENHSKLNKSILF